MNEGELTLVFEGDDDSISGEVLSFAGMWGEYPDADFALLDNSDIMEVAYKHADSWDEEVFDNGAPGGCYGIFRFYAKDPEAFRQKLASSLRPICRQLMEDE